MSATGERTLPARTELAGAPVLSRGGWGNPDVLLVRHGGRVLVVKDFAPRARWVRETLGRWLTRREARAWAALSGHPHVPEFAGTLDAFALAAEYRPGRPVTRRLARELPAGFLGQLDAAIAGMHARGVVHLDLRHQGNLLLGDDGEPVLLDFASALVLPAGSRPGAPRAPHSRAARLDRPRRAAEVAALREPSALSAPRSAAAQAPFVSAAVAGGSSRGSRADSRLT